MFLCENINHEGSKIIGPRIGSILHVLSTRERIYPNGWDEEGIHIPDSVGSEIVRELRVCPECKGLKPPTEVVVDWTMFKARADNMYKHVQDCPGRKKVTKWVNGKKETVETECPLCQTMILQWSLFPPQVLSVAVAEDKSPGPTFTFAMVASDNMFKRSFDETVRAKADIKANHEAFGPYISRGGGL